MKYRVWLKSTRPGDVVYAELGCVEFVKWLEDDFFGKISIQCVKVGEKEIDFKSLVKNLKFD